MSTDYETYKEIIGELLQPIRVDDIDPETLKSLYDSKLVYLENLRIKCFREINSGDKTPFSLDDYQLVLKAIQHTRHHIRDLILFVVRGRLERRKVV